MPRLIVALCLLVAAVPVAAQTEGATPTDPLAAAILGVPMADPAKLGAPSSPPVDTWPRLPTDGELAAAMNDYAARLAVAISTVRVTLGEPIKMHAPGARNPTQSSMAAFPYDLASDGVRVTPYCVGVVDYWPDLGFHVGSSFISNCWDTRDERAAYLAGYLKENGGWRVPGFPSSNFRLEVAPLPGGALGFTARLLRVDPADPQAAPEPVAGEPLVVHAFDEGHNAWKLADAFLANGVEDTRLAHLAGRDGAGQGASLAGGSTGLASQSPAARAEPLTVTTDAEGRITLEFLLDFGRLAQNSGGFDDVFLPLCNLPLTIDIPVAYEAATVPGGPKVELVSARARVSVNYVAVVVGNFFLEPLVNMPTVRGPSSGELFVPAPPTFPRRTGPLAEYANDGLGTARVSVRGDSRCAYAAGDGTPLPPGARLSVGDTVVFLTMNMTANGSVPYRPREPGSVWMQIRFLDGVEGQVNVNALVPRWEMRIGSSEQSGFTPTGMGFVYWAGKQAVQKSVEWVAKRGLGKLGTKIVPVLGAVDTANDVWGTLRWMVGAQPRYVRLRSLVYGEFGPDGELIVTTREGEPLVYGPGLAAEGVLVPVGRTAFISDAAARVEPTEEWRGRRADAMLAGDVQTALAARPPDEPAAVAAGATAPAGETADPEASAASSGPGLVVWLSLSAVGVALLVAVIVLVVVVRRRTPR
jgi:hypothetical protein